MPPLVAARWKFQIRGTLLIFIEYINLMSHESKWALGIHGPHAPKDRWVHVPAVPGHLGQAGGRGRAGRWARPGLAARLPGNT